MARKRRTSYTASEWRRKFAEAARICRVEAKRRGIRFQDCIREKLK